MKGRALFVCALLPLLVSACMLVGGCSSAGGPKGAYPTLKQTEMNVHWPMTRYRNAVSAGAVTLGERQRVDEAYKNFKEAYDAAVQAAHNDLEVTTPDNVKALANQVIDSIAAIPF
jgi:hypothetical protein